MKRMVVRGMRVARRMVQVRVQWFAGDEEVRFAAEEGGSARMKRGIFLLFLVGWDMRREWERRRRVDRKIV